MDSTIIYQKLQIPSLFINQTPLSYLTTSNQDTINPISFSISKIPSAVISTIINNVKPFNVINYTKSNNKSEYQNRISHSSQGYKHSNSSHTNHSSLYEDVQQNMIKINEEISSFQIDTLQNSLNFKPKSNIVTIEQEVITNKKNCKQSNNTETSNFIPEWMKVRNDFKRMYFEDKILKHLNIPKILCKSYLERSTEENIQLQHFLSNVTQFKGLKQELFTLLSKKMDSVIYPEKSIIVQKNEIPNFIGFIYDGKVKEIFQDGKFKIYKGGDVFNRQKEYEGTQIISLSNSVIIKLKNADLDFIINNFWRNIYRDFIPILSKTQEFCQLDHSQIMKMLEVASLKLFLKNEIITKIDEEVQNLYTVFNGQLECVEKTEKIFENRWPKVNKNWEVKRVVKPFYNKRILSEGKSWGYESLFQSDGKSFQQVVALENSLIVFIKISDLHNILSRDQIIYLGKITKDNEKGSGDFWMEKKKKEYLMRIKKTMKKRPLSQNQAVNRKKQIL